MLRSLYTATTGMIVQRNKMDNLTNNITNVDTIGYKKDYMLTRSFDDVLIERINDPNVIATRYVPSGRNPVGDHNWGLYVDEVHTSFAQGAPEQTEQPNELALQGEGFFVVQTPQGDRYTRAGNFRVDSEGYLVNQDGYYVQSTAGGRVYVGNGEYTINALGNVTVDGNMTDTISVVTFNDLQGLRKDTDNLYYHYANEAPVPATDYQVLQGYIETSNVSVASEMVEMIATSRAYETCYKAAQMIDQTLSKTVNDIARF
ncbi:MAG: flagellar basal-body rod protein FlgF [Clostridia bacterium]|nr:flagellar basal-body rod protein FlgF [Clostridia bacterium]